MSFDEEVMTLRADVETVFEKVTLVREMVNAGVSLEDGLGEVVGFLEACGDRVPDLIKAGSEGVISETLFARVLELNDIIQTTLKAERENTKIPILSNLVNTAPSTSAAPKKTNKAVQKQQTLADELCGLQLAPAPTELTMKDAPPMKAASATPDTDTSPGIDPFAIDLGDGIDSMSPFHADVNVNNPKADAVPPPAPATKAEAAKTDEEDFDSFLAQLQNGGNGKTA